MFSKSNDAIALQKELVKLKSLNIVKEYNGYFIYNNDETIVTKRTKGNAHAKNIMPKALKQAQFISKFPYIESVSISGALSKGCYDNDGDIDFFIITKPNRLWIARTLLILFKKVFLLNSKKYFCVNYFISKNDLEIKEKNLFTATELRTLIPITGKAVFSKFLKQNTWAHSYLPNINNQQVEVDTTIKPFIISKFIEYICNKKIGNRLENHFKNLTLKRWESKFKNIDKKEFEIALKSTETVSKHHPQNFQKKVMDAFNAKKAEIETTHHINAF
ncbi:nucleotidyltransferase domain-containing protein [Algibacter miyuki]|uniref:Nucleotidyltransferase domain-containing protein n=1 Tax=Algibacter miyuki TaxID=1306933 RepID=A0ABV5GWP6_9FLAO|nr:nucleotidyltransferase domain-containing protein [Algibacter miyuki]MDN3664299.1 nucleotidyltransferase domain-containing protein [Algibacter miyuki]